MLEEVREWQSRPLERLYPIVFLDALRVKVRDEGLVRNKAVYVALGISVDGEKEVLGLWIEQTEGAKFWLKVLNALKSRGVEDMRAAAALSRMWRIQDFGASRRNAGYEAMRTLHRSHVGVTP